MRRFARWTGALLSLGLGLSGIGTRAAAEGRKASLEQDQGAHGPAKTIGAKKERQGASGGPEAPSDLLPGVPPFAAASDRVFDLPSPATDVDFAGLPDNIDVVPPMTQGAVGPGHLMTMLNSQFVTQEKGGGAYTPPLGTPTVLRNFWTSWRTSASVFAPRILYDRYQDRWIWVVLQAPLTASSGLLVAVSENSTPNPPTKGTLIDLDNTDMTWGDSLSVGFNKNWVVVQINMYSMTGPPPYPFIRSKIYIFNKADLYGGTFTRTELSLDNQCGGASCGASQVPAVTYDNAVNDLYLVQMLDPASGKLRLYRITGSASSPSFEPLGYAQGPPWSDSAPPTNPPTDLSPKDFAPQGPGCGANKIQTGDSRIQNVVYRNGKLWTTHTVFYPAGGNPTRAAVQWWQLDPLPGPDPSVVQRGVVEDPLDQRFYAFPSIAVNKDDHVLLGFSSFAGTEYASAGYVFRLKTDPLGRMRTPITLKSGETCYYRASGGKNVWGPQSTTVVDPDDTKLWTLQEYANTPNPSPPPWLKWGTWWGMLDPTPLVSSTTVSIWDAAAPEGDVGTRTLSFDVTLSEVSGVDVTVPWSTADGTATTADNDYLSDSGSLVFTAGQTLKTIQVQVNGDIKREADETLAVNLGAPTNATVAVGTATGTITNDDALPQISIGDVRLVEGNAGTTPATFEVTLSNPSGTDVTVNFATTDVGGTATSGADFLPNSGMVTFPFAVGTGPYPTNTVEQTVTVDVVGDTGPEPDETYFVDLSAPSGGTLVKSRGTGLILDDDQPNPDVSSLTVVSDSVAPHGSSDGRNRLEWVNPSGGTPDLMRIGWSVSTNTIDLPGGTCTAPTDPLAAQIELDCPGACPTSYFHLPPLSIDHAYCYTVWIDYDTGPGFAWSSGVPATGVPFNATGSVKWKYFTGTGATGVAPPSIWADMVLGEGVLGPSNDNFVHGMSRGSGGGTWPAGWKPVNLGSPAQARSPIVPMAGGWRAFFTTQDGWVHAVDAQTGAIIWETQLPPPLATPIRAQAAPAGIFVAFGGDWDYLLVGTRDTSNPNYFYALSPLTGAVLDQFPQAGERDAGGALIGTLGAVNGMAGVDYQRRRVCFGSIKSTVGSPDSRTLWCLNLGPPGDALSFGWALDQLDVGDVDGSPIIRGNRLYVGNTSGELWAIDPDDPGNPAKRYAAATSDGGVKAFPFPDASGHLYFSTTNQVHACFDTGASFDCTAPNGWTDDLSPNHPSPVLFSSGKVYVGDDLGRLLGFDAGDGTVALTLQLDKALTPAVIGAPSLDAGFSPNIVLVGSTNGIFYAVEVP